MSPSVGPTTYLSKTLEPTTLRPGGILKSKSTEAPGETEALKQVVDEGIKDQMTATEPPKELKEPNE